jgi:hypothetical protein
MPLHTTLRLNGRPWRRGEKPDFDSVADQLLLMSALPPLVALGLIEEESIAELGRTASWPAPLETLNAGGFDGSCAAYEDLEQALQGYDDMKNTPATRGRATTLSAPGNDVVANLELLADAADALGLS